MYLQLAEMPLADMPLNYAPYVWIPDRENGGGFWIREDKLDLMMDDDEFEAFQDEIAPYEAEMMGLSEDSPQYLAGRAQRQARRQERQAIKTQKKAAKADKKQAKADAKRAKGEAKIIKAEAKRTKAENKTPEEKAATADIIKTGIGTVGGLVGSIFGKTPEGEAGSGSGSGKPEEEEKDKTMTYVLFGLGGLAVVGIAYALLSNDPKKS